MNNIINDYEQVNVLCNIDTENQPHLNNNWLNVCILRNITHIDKYDTYHNIYIPEINSVYNVTFDSKDNSANIKYYGMECEKNNGFSRAYVVNETDIQTFLQKKRSDRYAIIKMDVNYLRGVLRQ